MDEQNLELRMKMFEGFLRKCQEQLEQQRHTYVECLRQDAEEREKRFIRALQKFRRNGDETKEEGSDQESEPKNPRDKPATGVSATTPVSRVKEVQAKPPQFSGNSQDYEQWREVFLDFARLWKFQSALTRTTPIRIGEDAPRNSKITPLKNTITP